ncbi:hypothetical protein [Stenotrophomonas sp. NLF4-10]|uniref:hypothetical protein n=1 Tax=Stenotrophomonas sp. NLF4-10 TaxID=2918754 RepID=UPI001EFBD15C|nr:hypothetical protein [Stenotrophomonas sp. NLF4-10]MCG8277900.1 hypothetical protein [Stenotrophomonas sp. NLF4-10]
MLNKKVLAAALVGALLTAAGAATAAPLTVTKQYYANEIVFPTTGLVPTAAPSITWASGYNYSINETKYVRVELTGAKFVTGMPAPTVANGNVGAINGLGTNVLTFSVTSTGPIVAADNFQLTLSAAGVGYINIPTKGDVSIEVSLYDQASQAQAGGPDGRLQVGSYDDTVFLTFKDSYAFTNAANNIIADVASAAPSVLYGDFLPDAGTTPATTITDGTLNDDLHIGLVDPDGATGPQTVTFKADGTNIGYADLFAATSELVVDGDWSAADAVALGGTAATAVTGSDTKLAWAGIPTGATAELVYTVDGDTAIVAGDYKATFTPVSADATQYTVKALTANLVGSIRRNGLELQAPLAQVPNGWLSRLVLTNTGSDSPKYTITVLGETGNTITTDAAKLTGEVAPGTNVIDVKDVLKKFSADPRATIVVNVEAKDAPGAGNIQGLYQIVNPDKGSVSNHVMVRPGTN